MKIDRRYEPGGVKVAEAPDPDDFIQLEVPVCVEVGPAESGALLLEYEVEGLGGGGRKSERIDPGCEKLPFKVMREHFLDGRRLHLRAMPEGERSSIWGESFVMSHDQEGRPHLERAA